MSWRRARSPGEIKGAAFVAGEANATTAIVRISRGMIGVVLGLLVLFTGRPMACYWGSGARLDGSSIWAKCHHGPGDQYFQVVLIPTVRGGVAVTKCPPRIGSFMSVRIPRSSKILLMNMAVDQFSVLMPMRTFIRS